MHGPARWLAGGPSQIEALPQYFLPSVHDTCTVKQERGTDGNDGIHVCPFFHHSTQPMRLLLCGNRSTAERVLVRSVGKHNLFLVVGCASSASNLSPRRVRRCIRARVNITIPIFSIFFHQSYPHRCSSSLVCLTKAPSLSNRDLEQRM